MENGIIYIDKAGLEDLLAFPEAEFEIFDDYYNSGQNNKINNVTENLYDLRLKLKTIKTCTSCY